jgi:hypothetical protein
LVNTSDIVEEDCTVVDSPPTLALAVAIQEQKVAVGFEVNANPTAEPEHLVIAVVLVITGKGFTVTGTVIAAPTQPDAVGVTE